MTEHKSLMGRWVLIALVVGAALAAFWSHISPARPFGLTLGQDLRGGTTLRFSLDLDAARKLNRIPSGETDAQIVKETLAVIETRVNRFGLAEINITPIGDDKFEISIPSEVDADSIKKVVAALGELQFRIEVKPFYDEFRGQNGEVRTRNQVWTGAGEFEATPDGFQKFKEAELAIWKKAREAGVEYKPSDARYKLVPREETARATVGDFVVVEEPEAKSRLGGDILTNIRPGPDGNGGPGVHFDVKTDWQGVFHEWTSANVGLPMSILLNGEYHSAPVINSPLKDNVVITLGGGSMFGAGAAEAMKRLVVEPEAARRGPPVGQPEGAAGRRGGEHRRPHARGPGGPARAALDARRLRARPALHGDLLLRRRA